MVDYINLVVWEALQEDVGLIRARIDQATRESLGVSIGEINHSFTTTLFNIHI